MTVASLSSVKNRLIPELFDIGVEDNSVGLEVYKGDLVFIRWGRPLFLVSRTEVEEGIQDSVIDDRLSRIAKMTMQEACDASWLRENPEERAGN